MILKSNVEMQWMYMAGQGGRKIPKLTKIPCKDCFVDIVGNQCDYNSKLCTSKVIMKWGHTPNSHRNNNKKQTEKKLICDLDVYTSSKIFSQALVLTAIKAGISSVNLLLCYFTWILTAGRQRFKMKFILWTISPTPRPSHAFHFCLVFFFHKTLQHRVY